MIGTAVILTILAVILSMERLNGQFGFARPLVACAITGLLLGDLRRGIEIGVSIQLIFIGVAGVGAAVPPDEVIGSILATAFAILSNQGPEFALSLAVPVAVASQAIDIFGRTLNTSFLHIADKQVAENKIGGLNVHLWALLTVAFRVIIVMFPAVAFGVEAVQRLIAVIPPWVLRGMEVSGGLLPLVGFAMLFNMFNVRHLLPFFFIGFAMATFAGFSIVGATVVAVCIALLYDFIMQQIKSKSSASAADSMDDLDRLMEVEEA